MNQYASVSEGETSFVPEYDLDGNATRLRTSTGTWSVEYDAHNRPVSWRKSTGEVVYMIYDAQGRRAEKRVLNASGKRTLRERYVYVGYTCVQVLNGDKNNALVKEFAWDPTEPTATRPLTFRHAEKSLMLFYAFDGNKNVSDLFFLALQNGIGAHYEYAPFGAIVRTAKATSSKVDLIGANPWRFSSEFYDSELDLVYYNYRHYSPALGRWLSRDPIEEQGGRNLYGFVGNSSLNKTDLLGQKECLCPCSDYSKTRWKGGLTWEGRSFRTKSGHNPSVNGCGPENGFLNTGLDIVPDSFFGKVFFNSACNIHDRCYGQICVSSPEHKKLCDEELERDMLKACTAAFRAGRISPAERWLCEKQAKIYYNAVLSMGGGAFEDAQDDACVWEECKLF